MLSKRKKERNLKLWEGGIHMDENVSLEDFNKIIRLLKEDRALIKGEIIYVQNLGSKACDEIEEMAGVSTDLQVMKELSKEKKEE